MRADLNLTKQSGVSLFELIVAIAILGIVLAIAAPDMGSVIANNRSTTASNELIKAMNMARSEAIKRGVSVSVCAAQDANFNSCGNDWTNGWIVFVNPDENTTIAGGTSEPIIAVKQLANNNLVINVNPNISIATFTSTGFANASTTNAIFSVSATGCSANNGRNVQVSFSGKPQATPFNCP